MSSHSAVAAAAATLSRQGIELANNDEWKMQQRRQLTGTATAAAGHCLAVWLPGWLAGWLAVVRGGSIR